MISLQGFVVEKHGKPVMLALLGVSDRCSIRQPIIFNRLSLGLSAKPKTGLVYIKSRSLFADSD
jgi:hypothetical protein